MIENAPNLSAVVIQLNCRLGGREGGNFRELKNQSITRGGGGGVRVRGCGGVETS